MASESRLKNGDILRGENGREETHVEKVAPERIITWHKKTEIPGEKVSFCVHFKMLPYQKKNKMF